MSLKSLTNFKNMPVEVKVSTAYAICSIIQNCIQFITLPIFTRLLTKEQFGQYTVYSSWSSIFAIFITLNLAYGSFSTAMVKFEKDRDAYISSVQGICVALAGIFLLLYLPLRKYWNVLLGLPTPMVVLMVVEILANAAILFWNGKMRFEFRYIGVVAVTLFNAFVGPFVAYLLVTHTEEKGYARIIGYAGVTIIVGGIIFIMNGIKGGNPFKKEYWKYAISFNVPLIAYYLSQTVFNQSDRIMIDHMCGKDKAAVYGVAYTLAIVLTFVLNAINNSYVPWFYNKIKENNKAANRAIANLLSILMAVLLACVIWLAPELIYFFGGKSYMEAVWVVPPVALSVLLLFYAQMFINVEFYFEEKKKLVGASIAAAVINIVLNFFLIPIFGYYAAGYTTLFSYLVFAFSNYGAMKKVLAEQNQKNDAFHMKGLIFIFIAFLAIGFLGMVLYDYLVIRIMIMAVVLLGLIIMHKRIIALVQKYRK